MKASLIADHNKAEPKNMSHGDAWKLEITQKKS